jgi:hypothetical protein
MQSEKRRMGAQWLSQVFAANGPHIFDLTIVSHAVHFCVEPGPSGINRNLQCLGTDFLDEPFL